MVKVPKLLPEVRKTIRALSVGPEHAGLVRLAETLAAGIDSMDGAERTRLLGQTAPSLLKTLGQLAALAPRVQPRSHQGYALEQLRLRHVFRASNTPVPEVFEMGCECLACHSERAGHKGAGSATNSAG